MKPKLQRARTPHEKARRAKASMLRRRRIRMHLKRDRSGSGLSTGSSTPKHKARKPGTVRPSRMAGGSGFRNNWE